MRKFILNVLNIVGSVLLLCGVPLLFVIAIVMVKLWAYNWDARCLVVKCVVVQNP